MEYFCSNCGVEISNDDKYCKECGTKNILYVDHSVNQTNNSSSRKQLFEGEVHKCPNCGEVLNSLQIVCPSCGMDIRNAKATTSVQILSDELKAMEWKESDDYTIKGFRGRRKRKSEQVLHEEKEKSAERIANHIRNYAVPNTKEDILEFLILAASNINIDSIENYGSGQSQYKYENIISNAWIGKFEQIYEKSKVMLKDDPVFEEIEKTYKRKEEEIVEAKRKSRLKEVLDGIALVFLLILMFGFLGFIMFFDSKQENREPLAEENEYREEIVEEINEYIENGDYKLALEAADDLSFEIPEHKKWAESYYEDMQRKWEKKQKKIIRKIKVKMKEGGE